MDAQAAKRRRVGRVLTLVGVLGLAIALIVNFAAVRFVDTAAVGEPDWWSQWFVLYVAPGALVVIGAALTLASKR